MESTLLTPGASAAARWTTRVVGAVAVLFLLFDAVSHIAKPAPVVDAFAREGIPLGLAAGLGFLELALLVLYLIPRTAILGAILLTGYLGGAVSVNLRAGDPPFEIVFPVLFGVLVWAPLYLSDDRLRALFPLRRST
jgi:hypothetical protein